MNRIIYCVALNNPGGGRKVAMGTFPGKRRVFRIRTRRKILPIFTRRFNDSPPPPPRGEGVDGGGSSEEGRGLRGRRCRRTTIRTVNLNRRLFITDLAFSLSPATGPEAKLAIILRPYFGISFFIFNTASH